MAFYNLARMYTTTTGTGTVTLTTAVPGCLTFDLAGVANGATVNFGIITYDTNTHRPTHAEVTTGVYTTSGTTLTRATVEDSTNGGSKITLTGLSEVFLCPLASDFAGFGGGGGGSISFASYYSNSGVTTIANAGSDFADVDTEEFDADSIASVAANTITVAGAGTYDITLIVALDGGVSNIGNGRVQVTALTNGTSIYDPDNFFGFHTAMAITYAEVTVSGLMVLGAGNTIKARIVNDSGISLDCSVIKLDIKKLA